jgi:two-component system OmpR family response regulator
MGHVQNRLHHAGLGPAEQLADRLLRLLARAGLRADLLTLPLRRPPAADDAFPPDLLLVRAPADPADLVAALGELRGAQRLPCLVLAPRLPGALVAALLDAGADDVLDPAEPPEVALARARAVLRRGGWGTGRGEATAWRLVPARRTLLRPCGADAQLTSAEFDLFRLLTHAPGATICRDTVAQHVLRRRIDPTDRSVDNLVMRLRRKLGQDSAVKTVRGQGYMFAGFETGALLLG